MRASSSLYLDSSVIGGSYDTEFRQDTLALWRLRDAGYFRFVSSEVVAGEIAMAPDRVRELMGKTFMNSELLKSDEHIEALAQAYLVAKILPRQYADDARHVAICTYARLDFLVSWNFKHLANARREAGFNAVNLLQGQTSMRIVSPTILIHEYDKKTL